MAFWGKSFQDVGNIFKSSWGKSWDDFYNSFDGFDKKLDVTGGKIKAFGGAIGNGLKDVFTKTKDSPFEIMADGKATTWIDEFAKATDGGAEAMQKFNKKLKDPSMKAYLSTVDAGGASLEGYTKFVNDSNTALKATSISSKAAVVGMKALSVAMNVGVMLAVSLVLDKAIKKWDQWSRRVEIAKDKAEEFMQSYDSQRKTLASTGKAIDELSVKYPKLANGVDSLGKNISLNTEEYQEYNEIVNQIAEMFPSMVQGYTDEGNAILIISK